LTALAIVPCIVLMRAERAARAEHSTAQSGVLAPVTASEAA
jgi:hypothetical protein